MKRKPSSYNFNTPVVCNFADYFEKMSNAADVPELGSRDKDDLDRFYDVNIERWVNELDGSVMLSEVHTAIRDRKSNKSDCYDGI